MAFRHKKTAVEGVLRPGYRFRRYQREVSQKQAPVRCCIMECTARTFPSCFGSNSCVSGTYIIYCTAREQHANRPRIARQLCRPWGEMCLNTRATVENKETKSSHIFFVFSFRNKQQAAADPLGWSLCFELPSAYTPPLPPNPLSYNISI